LQIIILKIRTSNIMWSGPVKRQVEENNKSKIGISSREISIKTKDYPELQLILNKYVTRKIN